MHRLDGVSTYLLLREEAGGYQHTLKIGIFDTSSFPGGWDFDRFKQGFERGMELLPIFRCKVMRVPLGLHRPVWVEDPEFSVGYHLRYASCPPPGDNKALCALISQIYAYRLDPTKPLWQTWVIDGLADKQVAIVTLLHHAYTDGTGAARLMERFFKPEPGDGMPEMMTWHAEEAPGKLALVLASLRDIPGSLVTALPRVIKGMRQMRRVNRQYADSGGGSAPNPFRDSRDSPFNILLSHERTFVFETFDFSPIRATSKAFGVTVNELFLAIVADVFRQFMLERGYDADKGPLLATIPLERRPPVEQDDMVGNKTSADYLWLPVHLADPVERLHYAHVSSETMKAHFKAIEGADPGSIMEILPLFFFRLPDWIVKHRKYAIGQNANALLSNVKGPSSPLYWGKIPMTNWISMGQINQGTAINTTVWSYAGKFNLCVMADKKLLPDGWAMMDHFRESFDLYKDLANRPEKLAAST